MPGFQYWISATAIFVVGSLILNVVLALLGLKEMRTEITLGFILLGVILAFAGAWSAARQEEKNAAADKLTFDMRADVAEIKKAVGITAEPKSQEITQKGIVGVLEAQKEEAVRATKDNVPFFKVLETDASNPVGPMRVNLVSSGGPVFAINYWISPADNKGAEDPKYWSIDQRKPLIPVVYPNSREWVRFLPPGDYLIEIDALTGHWKEYLSINRDGNKLKQNIKVVKDGVAVYSQEING